MARIIFTDPSRNSYFSSLKKLSKLSWKELAQILIVSSRQFQDWKKGRATFPKYIADRVEEEFGLVLPEDAEIKDDYWHNRIAAKLGGKRYYELYGPPPATRESRRKGGLNSLKTHILRRTGFILKKEILKPFKNENLAEITGALLGDGGISPWQVKISLNLKTDKEYGGFLKELIEVLFRVNVSLYEMRYKTTLDVVASSSSLVSFLNRLGLPVGNKIKQGLDIPSWIHKHKSWQKACLRGLFDTDGCTYIDHHRYKNKVYAHIGLAFTSYSDKLLVSIANTLIELGYTPTLTTKFRVLLRKENEVLRFFNEVKPHNNRHYGKLREFLEGYRSGYNGIASKAIV